MNKRKFLESWLGPRVGANRLKWKRVEGGSLTDKEDESLKKGDAVFHRKSSLRTKIFVMDEEGARYAVTIDDVFLDLLKAELSGAGYNVEAPKS